MVPRVQGEAITHVISIAMFAIGLTLTKRELLAVVRSTAQDSQRDGL